MPGPPDEMAIKNAAEAADNAAEAAARLASAPKKVPCSPKSLSARIASCLLDSRLRRCCHASWSGWR